MTVKWNCHTAVAIPDLHRQPGLRCWQSWSGAHRFLCHGRRGANYLAHSDRPSGSTILPGSGIGNKSFSREGFVGQFYFGPHVDLTVVTQHGEDNAWFGQGYGDFIDGVATANNTNRNHPSCGSPKPHLEMGCCSNRITSTARNSSSSAGMKRSECRNKRWLWICNSDCVQLRQYLHLHHRLSL